ncbi:DUF5662 family protein [Bacteroides caecimuris]|jgi:hypothetical protein|uniref:DUF5662 family protein n=1 Tax=Bacteroides caecimuris TaxID=1796613 RepID=UPI0026EA841B|nr:DUF5662 family protein [Bacteroides caecimuris]
MSYQYDQYLIKHKENVKNGFDWIRNNLPDMIKDIPNLEWQCCFAHDQSKSESDEYEAYDAYFYGNNKSYQVVQDYRKAWLLHLHRNPHHWQHWVLINDDPKEGEILIEMPINYIWEMICDWWAFSWAKGNLHEIFKWYDEHKKYMKLHTNTRKKVEDILGRIKEKLDEETFELAHHGIKGQKWGVRRTAEQLSHDRYSIEACLNKKKIETPNGVSVTHISKHALDRIEEPSRRVTAKEIENALTKPIHIDNIKVDEENRRSQRFIGNNATVNANPDTGEIVTVWKTGERKRKKYLKGE